VPSPDLPRPRLDRPGALPRASLVQLPGVFGINRNQRSTSSEIGVRLAPKWPFGFARPTHLIATAFARSGSVIYSAGVVALPVNAGRLLRVTSSARRHPD